MLNRFETDHIDNSVVGDIKNLTCTNDVIPVLSFEAQLPDTLLVDIVEANAGWFGITRKRTVANLPESVNGVRVGGFATFYMQLQPSREEYQHNV